MHIVSLFIPTIISHIAHAAPLTYAGARARASLPPPSNPPSVVTAGPSIVPSPALNRFFVPSPPAEKLHWPVSFDDNAVARIARDAADGTGPDETTGTSPDETTGTGPDETAGTGPDQTTGTGPDQTAGSPDETAGTGPDQTAGSSPDETPGTGPDETTETAPDQTAGTGPDETAGTGPDETTGPGPDETTGTGPDQTAGSSPDETPGTGPDETTETGAEETAGTGPGETAGTGPDETAGSSPDETAGTDLDNTVGTSPDETTGTGPDAKAETGPDATAGTGPDATAGIVPDATAGTGPDATAGTGPDATAGTGPDATAGTGPDPTTTETIGAPTISPAETSTGTATTEAPTSTSTDSIPLPPVIPLPPPVVPPPDAPLPPPVVPAPPPSPPSPSPPDSCTPSSAPPETAHTLAKRDSVCGANFRSGVDKASCLPKGDGFTLTPPSTINKITVSTLPDDTLQCDHTVELQLLDNVLDKSGICKVIKAMVDAGGVTKADLLTPAFNTISDVKNINFLDSTVNNRKKTVVARSFKGQCQGSDDLDKAVGNYLQQTKDESESVASALDIHVNDIIVQATAKLSTLPDGSPRSTAGRIKAALNDAINGFQNTQSVRATWDKVLQDAPHT